jgi:hypothetical protein
LAAPRAIFLDHIILIVSMVAQMAAIAMTGLAKRICDITFPPMVLQFPGRASRQAGAHSGRHAGSCRSLARVPIRANSKPRVAQNS